MMSKSQSLYRQKDLKQQMLIREEDYQRCHMNIGSDLRTKSGLKILSTDNEHVRTASKPTKVQDFLKLLSLQLPKKDFPRHRLSGHYSTPLPSISLNL
jgi:hypothetical protein